MLTALAAVLPPEMAHRCALVAVSALPARQFTSPRLRTRLAGLELANPIGVAPGFDKNAVAFAGMLRQGFGSVEIGTVTPRPQVGNPRPRVFRLAEDEAIVNRLGFNNDGMAVVAPRLARRVAGQGVVGANIGMNKDAPDALEAYVAVLRKLYILTDYITVNVSSPNTPGLRALQKRAPLEALLGGLMRERSALHAGHGTPPKPLFVKIAPDLDAGDEAMIAEVILGTGIDGVIVSNTTTARPDTLRCSAAKETGGLSGRPLFAASTALLGRMAGHLSGRVALIGAGGIATGADAYAKIGAGADAVQLYTAIAYQGFGTGRRIAADLDALLARDGFQHVADAVGRDRR